MQRLLLIDGNAILHRAYHAFPPLTNTKGEIIGAVYGFFSMFFNFYQDQKPDYVAISFDRSKPTIRQTLYAGYHEHRPKPTDEFISQMVLLHEILEEMRVGIFELDGYEGDDLIGTIATRTVAEYKDIEVVIVTGDRDMLQLVNPKVKVLMPVNGNSKSLLLDEEKVEEKYGVHPRQFIDYKALIGDASDGYPGVTGIGPKTASNLLQKYITFENLYEHVGELPEKQGLLLATDAEQAALAKKLATIITDAPFQYNLPQCSNKHFALEKLRTIFQEQGFKSLTGRIDTVFNIKKPVITKESVVEKKKPDGQLGFFDE